MDVAGLLLELYGRIPPLAHEAVEGLGTEELTARPTADTNTIGWLIWHLTRVQDDHVAELLDGEQVWVTGPWSAQLGLDPDPGNTGYGHSAQEVDGAGPPGPRSCSTTSPPSTSGPAPCSATSPPTTSIASSTGAGTRP